MANHRGDKSRSLKFIITTGDPDGIGEEVTYKALLRGRFKQETFSIFFAHQRNRAISKLRNQVLRKYNGQFFDSLNESLIHTDQSARVRFIESTEAPPLWIERAARACVEKTADGLITAPLSKTLIRESGLNDIGHTEILARVCAISKTKARMGFVGEKFNVVLASGHIPIKSVAENTTAEGLFESLSLANDLKRRLSSTRKYRPIALLGMNPHASDHGLIGNEEETIFAQALQMAKDAKIDVIGPLVPDAAFLPDMWQKVSVYVCPYHDQGLIPFKMIHGQKSGAHITLGLPILRTSVDHGTAKDLFGKNKADPGSMISAIKLALKLGE